MNPLAPLTRRALLALAASLPLAAACNRALALPDSAGRQPTALRTRPIPSTGELLPVVGLGTYGAFGQGPSDAGYAALFDVVRVLLENGGTVIDSSPMYGRAEQTTGEVLRRLALPARPFLATKVWTHGRESGIAQMARSFELLQTDRIDLMQVHNLLDWRTHLPVLRDWKAQGKIRYLGVTHYTPSAFDAVEAVLRAEPLDFLQINYALDDREAEKRILPLCADKGIAVLCNRPFGGGGLLNRMKAKPLPGWAGEVGASTWAQLALKFVLANPAITCAIPGTGNPRYMAQNLSAGTGPLLSEAQRNELIALAE
jgi:aryl-alcohol dehydrogenase-like predicted oxidoreductase